MSLYRQAQAELMRRTAKSMDMICISKAGIQQFEALCNELRNLDHRFEPHINADHGSMYYTINTTEDDSGDIMRTLCVMGCTEVDYIEVELTGCKLYVIESDNTPRFTLSVAKTIKVPSHADA